MKKLIIKLMVAGSLILLFGASGVQAQTLLSIAAAPTGGTWYSISGAIGSIINKYVPGVKANVESTGGGEENARLIGTNQADLGPSIASTALNAYTGTAPYKTPYPNLRTMIATFQLGYLQMVVLDKSPMKYVSDIKGKRVVMGPPGHGSLPRQKEIYEEMGISLKDFTPVYLPYDDALKSLGDRMVDAAVLYMAPPAPALKEFGTTNKFRLLPIKEEHRKKIEKKHIFFIPITIPKTMYGLAEDVPTLATSNIILVREQLPEDLVYKITKAIMEHLDDFRKSHPSMKDFAPEWAVLGKVLPYHKGAEKYFKEAGLLK